MPSELARVEGLKNLVRERDRHRCTRCGTTEKAHVRQYGRRLHIHRIEERGEYSLANGITLCCICHSREHGRIYLPLGQAMFTVSLPIATVVAIDRLAKRRRTDRAGVIRKTIESIS